jgi:hypothetical protein
MPEKAKMGAGDAGPEGPCEAGVEPNVNEGALLASPLDWAGVAPKLNEVPEGAAALKLNDDD